MRFLCPWTSFSRWLAWMAVDLPSLKPVWYTLDAMRCGYWVLIRSRMAFSMILDRCDRTTIGLISSSPQGPLVSVFCSGTNLPTRKYSGICELFSASVISCRILLLSCPFYVRRLPSKQSGPRPLLKLDYFAASPMSSRLNKPVVSMSSSIISSSAGYSTINWLCMCSGLQ